MRIENKVKDHGKISPTAKITAYWKSLSDIPYAKEIAESINAKETAKTMLGDRVIWSGSISPAMFEARYKSINYGLKKSGINNVMELASGLSPRGLEIISQGGAYVGTDLQEMYEESSAIIRNIAVREKLPIENLHLQSANVLNKDELENAAFHFKGEKFAICNEGLLPYLSKEEKAKMAENVRDILLNNGGCWITTDIYFKTLREAISKLFGTDIKKAIKSAMKNISDQTGTDIRENDFADESEALKFYKDIGFKIEEFPMYAGDYPLSTASLIKDSLKDEFLKILSKAKVSILTPKS